MDASKQMAEALEALVGRFTLPGFDALDDDVRVMAEVPVATVRQAQSALAAFRKEA